METTVNFEADKARIARDILNIDNSEVLAKVKRSFYRILNSKKTKTDVTAEMIERFSGAWSDSRTAEENLLVSPKDTDCLPPQPTIQSV